MRVSSPLRSEGEHDVFLVRGEFEPEDPGISHHGAGHNHPSGTSSGVHHDQALVHISVDVLAGADPGSVPGLRAVVIILQRTQRVTSSLHCLKITKISCKLKGVLKLFLENCGFLFPLLPGRSS